MKLKELLTEQSLKDLGSFAQKTVLALHAFEQIEFLIAAFKQKFFGRGDFTSIGNEKSIIKKNYQNHIWFSFPKNVKPVFYANDQIKDFKVIQQLLGGVNEYKEVQPVNHLQEQEWYRKGTIKFNELKIIGVVYDEYAKLEDINKLKNIVNYISIMNYADFRQNNYKIK